MHFLLFLVIAAAYIAMVAWLVRDARRRGANPVLVGLLFASLGPVTLLGWLALRPPIARVIQTADDDMDSDDAFEAVSRLDSQGDCYQAIELYRYVAQRWPEQMPYAFACIREIHTKQDFVQ